MPVLDLTDDTFVVADPAVVAAAVADPARWRLWWPGLDLAVSRDRGHKGVQWVVRSDDWVGSAEVWLEPWGDGVVVHHYVRLDPTDPSRHISARGARRAREGWARRWKGHVHRLKDELEADRTLGARGQGRRDRGR